MKNILISLALGIMILTVVSAKVSKLYNTSSKLQNTQVAFNLKALK